MTETEEKKSLLYYDDRMPQIDTSIWKNQIFVIPSRIYLQNREYGN